EICYLKDANDLLFIQIQGSARIRLTDGTLLRVNYDSHNGHPYTAVGRILIERNIIAREDMSMDRIRKWMTENPEGGKELRRQNKSYVFFRTVGLPEHEEARDEQAMTRRRSLSEDERALWETVTRAVAPLRRRKAKIKEAVEAEEVAAPSPAKPPRKAAEIPARPRPAQRPAPPPLAPLGRRMR